MAVSLADKVAIITGAVSTTSSTTPVPTQLNAPYRTAKYAVVGMSLSLRIEGADLGVKVSVVCPGYVRTPIFDTAVVVGLTPGDSGRRPAEVPICLR
jgi:NAD(P)-dependent dehydrogenase (short-subunit alcohol dehydrogenase family)